MQSLVRHLHAFARDVQLTQAEWEAGIEFLTRTGHITDDRRQEFILLSDVLGLSMLTVAINAPAHRGATESTVYGPFFVDAAPEIPLRRRHRGRRERHALLGGGHGPQHGRHAGTRGAHRRVGGRRRRLLRRPVRRATASPAAGMAAVGRRGPLPVLVGGAYAVSDPGRRPGRRPARRGGPVARCALRTCTSRSPQPAYRTLITHIFVAGDEHLANDAVFGVKDSLVVDVVREDPGNAPDGTTRSEPWARIRFDIVLATGHER